jgi:hypothetical protein
MMKDITINKVTISKNVIYVHGTYLIDEMSFQVLQILPYITNALTVVYSKDTNRTA